MYVCGHDLSGHDRARRSAVVLLISSGCVLHDSWSLEGAMSNLFLGLLAAAGIAALWISTLCPHPALARNRYRFVLVTTGLLVGLILNCLILKARLRSDFTPVFAADLLQTWMYSGPLLVGCVNLALLIQARNRLNEVRVLAPARVSGVPTAAPAARANLDAGRAQALSPTGRHPIRSARERLALTPCRAVRPASIRARTSSTSVSRSRGGYRFAVRPEHDYPGCGEVPTEARVLDQGEEPVVYR